MNVKTIAASAGIIVAVIGAYFFGYEKAETEGELALESLKKANAEAVIAAQNEVRKNYEKRLETLTADLDRVRSDNAVRLRQLEKFRSADRDLETCRRDRERLAGVAVGLEDVARRAVTYLDAMK